MSEGKKPKNVKVGHTGTLDPFATGLLVLLIGKEYTRRAGQFSKLDKTYEVTMCLGQTSTTGDPEGEITDVAGPEPTLEQIRTAAQQFIGEIEQVPPAFSAIKINGQRAYKLARAGKEVIMEPRKVTIHRLEIIDYTYPEVKLTADVASGTYIRSLVEDLGQTLGTGAYTAVLKRTDVGIYGIGKALQVDLIDDNLIKKHLEIL